MSAVKEKGRSGHVLGPQIKRSTNATGDVFGIVSINGSPFKTFKVNISNMDNSDLLLALKHDDIFSVALKDVHLSQCEVWILKTPPDDEIPAPDDSNAVPLKGSKQVKCFLDCTAKADGDVLYAYIIVVTYSNTGARNMGQATIAQTDTSAINDGFFTSLWARLCSRRSSLQRDCFGSGLIPREDMAAFASACRYLEPAINNHLTLNKGMQWPYLNHSTLFVRRFYKPLFEAGLHRLRENVEQVMPSVWAIIGTPGVGKTALGLYLLYHALRQGRCVVHVHGGRKQTLVFKPNGQVWQLAIWDQFPLLVVLQQPSTVLLLDSTEVHYCDAFTVLLTLPEPSRTAAFKEDRDTKSRKIYVPVLSKSEILEMRSVCYPHVTEEAATVMYNQWGGSARAIFSPLHQVEMTKAVNSVDLVFLRDWLPQPNDMKDIDDSKLQSRLFRIYTPADSPGTTISMSSEDFYVQTKVDFMSPYVLWRVLQRIRNSAKEQLKTFIGFAHTSAHLSRIFDKIFERLCIEQFEKGVTLKLYPLNSDEAKDTVGEPITISYPRLKRNEVCGLKGFGVCSDSSTKDLMYVPTSESFPAIDFAVDATLLNPSLQAFASAVFNAAFDATHTICWEAVGEHGLKETLQQRKPSFLTESKSETCAFVWVVPEGTLHKWKHPRSFKANGVVVNSRKPGCSVLRRINQYVAYIEGLSESTVHRELEKGRYTDLQFTSSDPNIDEEL